jgi:hypothetical protein
VAVVRSTHRGPVELAPIRDPHEDEWDDFYTDPPPEILDDEEALPDPWDDDDWEPDEYDYQWDRVPAWDSPLDDAPAWEAEVRLPCTRCGERDDLDPLETCARCRQADGRCSWCGLDPIVYSADTACRTCYQRLRRARVTSEFPLRLSMLNAAFRRADLRKRARASG